MLGDVASGAARTPGVLRGTHRGTGPSCIRTVAGRDLARERRVAEPVVAARTLSLYTYGAIYRFLKIEEDIIYLHRYSSAASSLSLCLYTNIL